jgi:hypothetical protein
VKYVRLKTGRIKTTTNKGHHRKLAGRKKVASAGRYRTTKSGKVRTYSKSHGLGIKPKRGDAKRIKRHLGLT